MIWFLVLVLNLYVVCVGSTAVTNSSDIRTLELLFTSTGGDKGIWNYNTTQQCLSSIQGSNYNGRNWAFPKDTAGKYTVDPCAPGASFIGVGCSCDTNTCRVNSIALPCGNLAGTIPAEIGELAALTSLDLGNNSLSGLIPPTLGKLTQLQYLKLAFNTISGRLPDQLSDLTRLRILLLCDNKLEGPVPAGFRRLQDLRTLMIQKNSLRNDENDNAFSYLNRDWQRHLSVLDVSNNLFSGTIPALVFEFPDLNVFAADSNCFSGFLPDNICKSTTLNTLSLTSLTSGDSCRSYYFGEKESFLRKKLGWNGFRANHYLQGSLPSCIYTMPHLHTFQAAGNNFLGHVPAFVSKAMKSLDLSRNRLVGTISQELVAATAGFNNLTVLKMAYNRIDGSLDAFSGSPGTYFSNPKTLSSSLLTLETNRLSGDIPRALLFLKNIYLLQGNLFKCAYDRDDLPEHSDTVNSYQCGSTNLNYMLFAVAGFLFIIAAVYQLRKRAFGLSKYARRLTLWMAIVSGRVGFDDSGIKIDQIMRYSASLHSLRMFALIMSIPILGVLVMYFVLSGHTSRLLEHLYAWVSTAAYMQGINAAICLSAAGGVVIVVAASLIERTAVSESRNYLPHEDNHAPHEDEENDGACRCFSGFLLPFIRFFFLVLFIWGAVAAGTAQYMHTIDVDSTLEQQFWTLVYAAALLILTMMVTPFLLSTEYLSFGAKKNHHDAFIKCFFGQQARMMFILNSVSTFWMPLLTALAIHSDCFGEIFKAADPETIMFDYSTCSSFAADGTCRKQNIFEVNSHRDVPFLYNFTCSPEILQAFAPVYLRIYIFLVLRCGIQLVYLTSDINNADDPHKDWEEKSCLGKLKRIIEQIFVRIMPSQHLMHTSTQRQACYKDGVVFGNLPREWITEVIPFYLCDILLLLTYGVLAPAIASVIIMYLALDTYVRQFVLGRFLAIQLSIMCEHKRLHDPLWVGDAYRPDDPLYLSSQRRAHLTVDIKDAARPWGAIAVLKEMEHQCRYMPACFLLLSRTTFVMVTAITFAALLMDVINSRPDASNITVWPSILMIAGALAFEICTCIVNYFCIYSNVGTDEDDKLDMIEMPPKRPIAAKPDISSPLHDYIPNPLPYNTNEPESPVNPLQTLRGSLPLPSPSPSPSAKKPTTPENRWSMPYDPPSRPASVSVRKNFERQLYMIYATYNPDKIEYVPTLVENFKGREVILLDELRKKYFDADRKSMDLRHARLFMDVEEPAPGPATPYRDEEAEGESRAGKETYSEEEASARVVKAHAALNAASEGPASPPSGFDSPISTQSDSTKRVRRKSTPKARNAPILSMDDVIHQDDWEEEQLYDEDGVKIKHKNKPNATTSHSKLSPAGSPPVTPTSPVSTVAGKSAEYKEFVLGRPPAERTTGASNKIVDSGDKDDARGSQGLAIRTTFSDYEKEDEEAEAEAEATTPIRSGSLHSRSSSSQKKRPQSSSATTTPVILPDTMADFA